MKRILWATLALAFMAFGLPAMAIEVTPSLAPAPTGWTVDRYAPASFGNVGTVAGRSDVLGISIANPQAAANRPPAFSSPFYNTQGMGTGVTGGAGDSVSADIYIPASWGDPLNGARRSDMWLVVNDPSSSPDPRDFPIIGFTNSNGVDSFVGFRAWDSIGGVWNNLTSTVQFDGWNELTIDYLPGGQFQYSVNGTALATIAGSASDTTMNQLMFQAYNFGVGQQNEYTALWSNSVADVPEPASALLLGLGLVALGTVRRRNRV